MTINNIETVLHGCTPEPLMNYLKALGVLRLVSEDKVHGDPNARGFWHNDEFVLQSSLNRDALLEFFLYHYVPTPIIVPWSGNDFFAVTSDTKIKELKKTPTGSDVIEAFLACQSERLSDYREVIIHALSTLKRTGIAKKSDMEKKAHKSAYLSNLRSQAPASLLPWLDAAAVMETEKATFNALLGSGGGSDGNTHFSDNFMQNLWDTLPDFDIQRAQDKGIMNVGNQTDTHIRSRAWLEASLFATINTSLLGKRTASLFDSGAVGGPNATQGMEREAVLNPWNFILAIEGVICFAGALVKRSSIGEKGYSSFPFQFRMTVLSKDRVANKEIAGRELWLPLWLRSVGFDEVSVLLAEGRVEIGNRGATRSLDAARAAASFGVDRGICEFQRYAIVKGRVGGDNYNTAVSLGRFKVKAQKHVYLLREVDDWLYRFRRACKTGQKEAAPARFISALHRIDSAIFNYCRYGGHTQFQSILIALGKAERELMLDGRWAEKNRVPPLCGLSPDWIDASNDGTREFSLALALAGIRNAGNVGSLRTNLEPIKLGRRKDGILYAGWAEKDRSVVWNSSDLATNLVAVLARRILNAQRTNDSNLPLWSAYTTSLDDIAAFTASETDDRCLEELLWGLILIEQSAKTGRKTYSSSSINEETPPLSRLYALLKLLFLPTTVIKVNGRWRYTQKGEHGVVIRPEPRILPLLRAGRVEDAIHIAIQRLRSSGLHPMIRSRDESWGNINSERLAAALLFPISSNSLDKLLKLVSREKSTINELEGEQV